MRLLAHLHPDHSSPIITVHEALRLQRQNPEEWGRRYFYDLILLRYLLPVDRGVASTFASPKGCLERRGKNSKGIAHELVLKYICNQESWPVKLCGKEYLLEISSAIDEYFVYEFHTRNSCFVDCKIFLNPKSGLYKETTGRIGIEITNPIWWTKFFKRRAQEKFDLAVFELKMLPEWHVAHPVNITIEELKELQERIFDFLSREAKLTWLCKPAYVMI